MLACLPSQCAARLSILLSDVFPVRRPLDRYQFFLQAKKDMVDGRLPVPPELSAELSACVAQCEFSRSMSLSYINVPSV